MKLLRLVVWLLVGSALWQGYRAVAPERPDYTAAHAELAQKAAREAAVWFQDLDLTPEKTFFGNLGRDDFGYVSLPIRRAIRQLDKVVLVDRGAGERCREGVRWTLPAFGESAPLLAAARSRDCRYAIGGKVIRFSQLDQRVELELELSVWEVSGERLIAQKRIQLASPGAVAARVQQEIERIRQQAARLRQEASMIPGEAMHTLSAQQLKP